MSDEDVGGLIKDECRSIKSISNFKTIFFGIRWIALFKAVTLLNDVHRIENKIIRDFNLEIKKKFHSIWLTYHLVVAFWSAKIFWRRFFAFFFLRLFGRLFLGKRIGGRQLEVGGRVGGRGFDSTWRSCAHRNLQFLTRPNIVVRPQRIRSPMKYFVKKLRM